MIKYKKSVAPNPIHPKANLRRGRSRFCHFVESLEKAENSYQQSQLPPLLAICDHPYDPAREDAWEGGWGEGTRDGLGDAIQASGVEEMTMLKKRKRNEEVCKALRSFRKLLKIQKEDGDELEFTSLFEEDGAYY